MNAACRQDGKDKQTRDQVFTLQMQLERIGRIARAIDLLYFDQIEQKANHAELCDISHTLTECISLIVKDALKEE